MNDLLSLIDDSSEGLRLPTSVIISVVVALAGAIAGLFAMLMASNRKTIADLESRIKVYQDIATEAMRSARQMANYVRSRDGKEPIILDPPVITESRSPSTALQRDDAFRETLKAAMAKIKRAVGQPPHEEPPHASGPVSGL